MRKKHLLLAISAAIIFLTAENRELDCKYEKRTDENTQANAPRFLWRGVLEGFYGKPWSWKERQNFIPWMAQRNFNLFVIAPKDDDLLRQHWRKPLPKDYINELRNLERVARKNSVELVWSLSPGLDLKPRDPSDLAAAIKKYESVLALGVRRLIIAFDDTDPQLGHIDFANKVLSSLAQRYPDLEMTFVPAEYWSDAAPSRYLDRVAHNLDSRFRIAWTGAQIISRRITADQARRFRAYIQHSLVLGDNYPVQDRLVHSGRLFLGPLVGRDPDLVNYLDGFIANASPLPEASKLPLFTVADYTSNPWEYNPEVSWNNAIVSLGEIASKPLRLLARECATSWLSDSAPGAIWEAIESGDKIKLRHLLRAFIAVPKKLRSLPNSRLGAELMPWANKLKLQAKAVLAGLDILDASPASTARTVASARFRILMQEAENNPAVVSNLALDRLLTNLRAELDGFDRIDLQPIQKRIALYVHSSNETALAPLVRDLNRLIGGHAGLNTDMEKISNEWRGLNPLGDVLALSATRALHAIQLNGRRSIWEKGKDYLNDKVRWLIIRSRFISLFATKRLMDDFFENLENGWKKKIESRKKMSPLIRIWLMSQRYFNPRSFPVVLEKSLLIYRESGDTAELRKLFQKLDGMPVVIQSINPQLIEETKPWLYKVRQYGILGLRGLELRSYYPDRIPAEKLADWARLREDLRSGNGLELALELNFTIDALTRWARLPQEKRPRRLDLTLPANPADMF